MTTTYIGDGVYASFDGYQIWLRTEREKGVIHEIALEPKVFSHLCDYARAVFPNAADLARGRGRHEADQ